MFRIDEVAIPELVAKVMTYPERCTSANMQKLKRFKAEGFTELTTMSKEAGLQVESVKKLTALLLGFRISKSAQTSNWEAAKLNEKQISYAATDAWVCLETYQKLIQLKSR